MPSRLRPFPTRLLYGASPVWWQEGTAPVVADFFEVASSAGNVFTYAGTASISLAGVAAPVRTKALAGSGAIVVAGASPRSRTKTTAGAGSLAVSGSCVSFRVTTKVYAGTAAISVTGSSARLKSLTRAGSAALSAAGLSARLKILIRVATAAMSVTGSSSLSRARVASGSSASSVLGSSSISRTRSPSSLGSMIFGSDATHSRAFAISSTFPLTSDLSSVLEYTVKDTTVYTEWMAYDSDRSWVALLTGPEWSDLTDIGFVSYFYDGAGDMLTSGASVRTRGHSVASVAPLSVLGSAVRSRTLVRGGSGAAVFGGVSSYGFSKHRSYAGASSMVLAGAAACIGPHVPFVHSATFWISISGATAVSRTQGYAGTAAMSTAGSQGYAFKICVRQVASTFPITTGGQVVTARSRIRTYSGAGAMAASGSAVAVRTRIYNAKLTTVVTGGVAVALKLSGHYYGGTATILSGGLTPRSRTRVRTFSGGAMLGGSAASALVPVSIRAYAGTAALLSGGGHSRQRTVARVGTAALVLTAFGAANRPRTIQGFASLSLAGSAAVRRAHTASGDGAMALAGSSVVRRVKAVDCRATFALSMSGFLGLGVALKPHHAYASAHSAHVAFGEILEWIILNAPITVSAFLLSSFASGITTTSTPAAKLVKIVSTPTLSGSLPMPSCRSVTLTSGIDRVHIFDSLTLQ